ncbi:MAG: hypothetical protein ABEN55_21140 [Bradymonadaceae bacterium]
MNQKTPDVLADMSAYAEERELQTSIGRHDSGKWELKVRHHINDPPETFRFDGNGRWYYVIWGTEHRETQHQVRKKIETMTQGR